MAKGKVASFRLETRVAIADALVNGRDFEEIREYLEGAGMTAAELPSDHSLKTFQESVEYDSLYADRRMACDLQLKAGRVMGCASARVSLLQDQVLAVFERWMDRGLLEPADMFKVLAFTLQFQRQELATMKCRAQLGDAVPPEALGPQDFSKETLDRIMARLSEEKLAAAQEAQQQAEREAAAQDAEAVAIDGIDGIEASAAMPEDPAGSSSIPEDSAGSRRISEDSAACMSIPEDSAGSRRIREDSAACTSVPAEEEAVLAMSEAAAGANAANGASGSMRRHAVPVFPGSPTAETRKKARARRSKRRR